MQCVLNLDGISHHHRRSIPFGIILCYWESFDCFVKCYLQILHIFPPPLQRNRERERLRWDWWDILFSALILVSIKPHTNFTKCSMNPLSAVLGCKLSGFICASASASALPLRMYLCISSFMLWVRVLYCAITVVIVGFWSYGMRCIFWTATATNPTHRPNSWCNHTNTMAHTSCGRTYMNRENRNHAHIHTQLRTFTEMHRPSVRRDGGN